MNVTIKIILDEFDSHSIVPYLQDLWIVTSVVDDLFEERIEPNDGDARFIGIWPVDNRGCNFNLTLKVRFEVLL